MPTGQRRAKKPISERIKGDRGSKKTRKSRPDQADQPLHRPYRGYDEKKTGPDPSQKIGEFSDWTNKGEPFNDGLN